MKRTFGLRTALILLVLIAIVPVFAVVTWASFSEQRGRLARTEASIKALIDLSAVHQEQFIEGARQILTALAWSPHVNEDDLDACARYMQVLLDKYPRYTNLGLLDVTGQLVCRGTPGPPVVAADRLFFKRAMATGAFAVGEYGVGRASGRPSLAFGMPVFRPDHSLRGVLFVALDLQRADEQLGKVAVPADMTLVVTDGDAVVLASAGLAPLRVGSRVTEKFLLDSIAGGMPHQDVALDSSGKETLYAVRPVGQPSEGRIFVAVFASQALVLAPTEQRLYLQLAALSVLTLLLALAAWVFGDSVLARPIGQMLRRVDELRREELPLDAPPLAARISEIAALEERFRAMARGLAERALLRDAAMAEMLAQKDLLESVLESMSEGVLVLDSRAHLLHINTAARNITPGVMSMTRERDPLAVPALDWGLFHLDGVTPLAPADRPVVRALAGEAVEGYRYLVRGRYSGGPEKIIHATSRPLPRADALPAGAVLVFSDITQAWRDERALLDSELRYRTLFEANPHPMWVFDTQDLRFLTVNDAAVDHYGYSRQEFLAMTIRDIRPVEDVAALELSMAGTTRPATTAPQVWRHRLKDGRIISVEISSHPIEFGGSNARMVLAHDITLRLRAQEELAQLNDTLERRVTERTGELAMAIKELESFSYSVSHDLRAPLQVIDGFGRALIAKHSAQLNAQGLHYLNRIRENTSQMSQLIDDLLSLAKVTRTEIRAEPCNLAVRAAYVVEQLRARFPERQVQVDIDDDMQALGDVGLLNVVLENLIENAWKFTSRTEGAHLRIGRRAGPQGEAVYYVADNGAGFDMAYANKLFNAFQRLHAVTEFHGTGIGLATVHRIITRHGGRVWAQAAPGQGATFLFTLNGGNIHEEQPHPAGGGQPGSPGTDPDDAGREQRRQ